MTSRIFRSVFFTSFLAVLACLVLIFCVLFGFFERQLKKELASEAGYIAYALEDDYEHFFSTFSDSEKRITLIAADGTVMADTEADPKTIDNHANRVEFQEAQETGSGSSVRYSDTLLQKTVYYAKKLDNGNVLRVSTTQYSIVSVLIGLMQPILVVLAITLLLSFFLSSRVAKSVIRPINEIDLEHPENSDTYEELAPLLYKILNQNRTIGEQIKQAQQKQNEFKLITENMREGFLVIDKNAKLLSCNSAALRLLDAEKSDGNVLTLNRTANFRTVVHEALEGRHAENTMLHAERTYNLIANPVTEKQAIIGAVIVIIDITESAKREAIRREFTANVSHELKTPLTSISGFAELMKGGDLPSETVADFSSTIYAEAQRLITLVSDIIKISELDEKSDHFMTEDVDLYDLADEVLHRLAQPADAKHVALKLSGEHAAVHGVRQILEEMVYNLCDNAIKYNKENGTAEVTVNKRQDSITLTVRDTGIGIPHSQQDRVFERFYRVDKSRSKAEGGTGLGLSIVKHGALYHGAEISLESTVDKGTAITLTFHH